MQTGKAISIPSILKVGNGTLNKIGEYLKSEELTSVVIFMGNGLIDMFGDTIMKSLTDAGITVLEYSELDTVEIDDIITLAFDIPNKAKAVVSVGGGKVIDAGKYAAFLRNLPFISVPTSSSSDGFSSASASLLVHGKRTSVPAPAVLLSFFLLYGKRTPVWTTAKILLSVVILPSMSNGWQSFYFSYSIVNLYYMYCCFPLPRYALLLFSLILRL